jgi:hypothetical protein
MTVVERPGLIRLGDSDWHVWRLSALRGAGFPAACVAELADESLAGVVDRETAAGPASTGFQQAYLDAFAQASTRLAELGREPAFREAVLWQSPHLLDTCLDKIEPGRAGRLPGSKQRQRLLTTASYLQRYSVKNDSIGFFGPVGWAEWTAQPTGLTVRTGPSLLARRTVYFEAWAVDAVARRLSRDPALLPWLRPRRAPQNLLDGSVLLGPSGKGFPLDALEFALVELCDGVRTVRQIADEMSTDVEPVLAGLEARGVIRLSLEVPVSARPECNLRELLLGLPYSPAPALAALAKLVDARDAVAAAAGDVEQLRTALRDLGQSFRDVLGEEPTRRSGEYYAGRAAVYEDTVRDVDVKLGAKLGEVLAAPLDLLLRSARWLANAAADAYRRRFADLFEQLRARTCDEVPLALLYAAATPDLMFSFREPPPIVADVVAEFQRRWARILCLPDHGDRHTVASADIRAAVEAEFACDGPRWSAAVHHSPDVLLAARSPEAINRGDFVAIVGEVHVATNTIASRLFVEQSPDPEWLLHAAERDHAGRRIVAVPSKESAQVNSRTYPPALQSAGYTYWTLYPDVTGAPAAGITAAALRVVRRNDELAVSHIVDGREFDLLEVFGDVLTGAVMNSFVPLAPAAHRPRVAVDKVVMSRESWTFDVDALAWSSLDDAAERFRQAWLWRREKDIPRRCFYRVAVEDKPLYLDFAAVTLVELFCRALRRTARAGVDTTVELTEVLPDFDRMWLHDAEGRSYTSELRLVVVDPMDRAGASKEAAL